MFSIVRSDRKEFVTKLLVCVCVCHTWRQHASCAWCHAHCFSPRNLGFVDVSLKLLPLLQATNLDGNFEGMSRPSLDLKTSQPFTMWLLFKTPRRPSPSVTQLCVVASSFSVTWRWGTKCAKRTFGGRVSRISSCECCRSCTIIAECNAENVSLNTVFSGL